MNIQPVHYSSDAIVNAAAAKMVCNMAGAFSNPAHFTVAAIMKELARQYGAFANHVRITVH
jgi:hypothetical protein